MFKIKKDNIIIIVLTVAAAALLASCAFSDSGRAYAYNFTNAKSQTGVTIVDSFTPLGSAAQNADDEKRVTAREIFDLTNDLRVSAGYKPFEWDDRFQEAAFTRAKELSERFSNKRPDGSACYTVLSDAGYLCRKYSENIAKGAKTAAEFVEEAAVSSGHLENMLGANTYLSVGVYQGDDGEIYYVQLFTTLKN